VPPRPRPSPCGECRYRCRRDTAERPNDRFARRQRGPHGGVNRRRRSALAPAIELHQAADRRLRDDRRGDGVGDPAIRRAPQGPPSLGNLPRSHPAASWSPGRNISTSCGLPCGRVARRPASRTRIRRHARDVASVRAPRVDDQRPGYLAAREPRAWPMSETMPIEDRTQGFHSIAR